MSYDNYNYTVHGITPAPAKQRGGTSSDMTPAELKDIIIKVAMGSPKVMSDLTGIPAPYFPKVIQGYHGVSRDRCKIIRSLLQKESNVNTTVTAKQGWANPIPVTDIDGLDIHDALKSLAKVSKIILAHCIDCSEVFIRTSINRARCPDKCKPKHAADRQQNGKAKKIKNNNINNRPLQECGKQDCLNKLRQWNGRKYCEIHRQQKKPKGKKAEESKPVADTTLKGKYVGFEGSPCHVPSCKGKMTLRRGKFGTFYGCSFFKKKNRPKGAKKCEATCIFTADIDGQTFVGVEPASADTNFGKVFSALLQEVGELRLASNERAQELAKVKGTVASLHKDLRGFAEAMGTTRKEVSNIDWRADQINEKLDKLMNAWGVEVEQ